MRIKVVLLPAYRVDGFRGIRRPRVRFGRDLPVTPTNDSLVHAETLLSDTPSTTSLRRSLPSGF